MPINSWFPSCSLCWAKWFGYHQCYLSLRSNHIHISMNIILAKSFPFFGGPIEWKSLLHSSFLATCISVAKRQFPLRKCFATSEPLKDIFIQIFFIKQCYSRFPQVLMKEKHNSLQVVALKKWKHWQSWRVQFTPLMYECG